MSNRSEAVKKWRSNTKRLAILAFGSKCCVCGYKKCNAALQFHHLDPAEKDFGLAQMFSSPKAWKSIVCELKKCVLVCGNCHVEIHEGEAVIPDDAKHFDETLLPVETSEDLYDKCPNCSNQKKISQRSCSVKCARKLNSKVDWENTDLEALIVEYSYVEIGEMLGCSDSAVIKQLKKQGLYKRRFTRN